MTNTPLNLFIAAVVASFTAGAASAQSAFDNSGLIGDTAVETASEDLADDIEDDFERDIRRFGNEGREIGFDGSLALRATADTGSRQADDDDSLDLGIGSNLGYFDGVNGYELSLYYSYSEADGDTDDNNLLYNFQYTRDFNPTLYGFVKLQGSYEGDVDIESDSDDPLFTRENDVFLGFGAGYRIYNTEDLQWSVQAGPGYRFADFRNIGDAVLDPEQLAEGEGDDINEAAFSISSDYFQRINETVFLTNDTDIITSSSDTVLYNDLGLNVAMSNALALRTSVQSEYHTDPSDGNKSTEHLLGVSLVYNFN